MTKKVASSGCSSLIGPHDLGPINLEESTPSINSIVWANSHQHLRTVFGAAPGRPGAAPYRYGLVGVCGSPAVFILGLPRNAVPNTVPLPITSL